MTKSLVVGAAGQVGRQIVRELGPDRVVAAVRQPGQADQKVVDLEALALNPAGASLLVTGEIDAVYCAGGATDVERCETEIDWAMNTNCHGPLALAAAARHIPFVYFSTDYVFDGRNGPYREQDPTHALSVYGQSKLLAEQRLAEVHPHALVLRTNVVYGPDPAGKNFLYTLRRLIGSGTPMRVMDDQISTPTYSADLAAAAVQLVLRGQSGVFHVSGPQAISRYDFALRAAQILGLDQTLIAPVTTAALRQKAPRPLRGGLLNERLARELPSMQMRGIDEGIRSWAGTVS